MLFLHDQIKPFLVNDLVSFLASQQQLFDQDIILKLESGHSLIIELNHKSERTERYLIIFFLHVQYQYNVAIFVYEVQFMFFVDC